MENFLYYENGTFQENLENSSSPAIIKLIDNKYKTKSLDWKKDLAIRIFKEKISKSDDGKQIEIEILHVTKEGKIADIRRNKLKHWSIEVEHKGTLVRGNLYDKSDATVYVLWESIQKNLGINLHKNIKDLRYKIDLVSGDPTLKGKFILFFSDPSNCGKIWKYGELNEAMDKRGLKLGGLRGIGGERPRECRYALGYDWRTNDQDKNIPDGSCYVGSPFPFGPRNERRAAAYSLQKEDWSELHSILTRNPTRLRCIVCGLFDGETNHIGQKTTFQIGHGTAHLSGGKVSEDNIVSICKYCNGEMGNIVNIDAESGKKSYNIIPFIKKRSSDEKVEALKYLLTHLNKKIVTKVLDEFKL